MSKYLDETGLETLIDQIKQNMSKMYEIKGSAVYADATYLAGTPASGVSSVGLWQLVDGTWTKVTEFKEGWVFNIQNDFTTDSNFVEGAGTEVKAGTNIAVIKVSDGVYKFDVLAVATNVTNNIGSELPDNIPDTAITAAEIEAMFA